MYFSWSFTLSPSGFVMSMTSGTVPSDFLGFFDFGAGFREPAVFEAWELHFEPTGGITMMNSSHLNMR